jgi:cell division protein FtsZ
MGREGATTNRNFVELVNPMLIVGIGGVGAKIADVSSKNLTCECLLISNDKKDLEDENCNSIFINSNSWINPSSYKIRSFGQSSEAKIKSSIDGFSTIVLIANLAGRCGTAMAPIISKISKQDPSKRVISFVIMPFRFEKDRIFQAGISLKRLRQSSDATIVFDNDALLENNPDLSLEECHKITNVTLCEVISLVSSNYIQQDTSLLCTGRKDNRSAESHIKDCLAMLYGNIDPNTVNRATLYVMSGTQLPIGTINSIVNTLQRIFKDEGAVEVSLSVGSFQGLNVHLLASLKEKTRFDKYDPLGEIIPQEKTLDWEEMDSSPDIEITIPNIE